MKVRRGGERCWGGALVVVTVGLLAGGCSTHYRNALHPEYGQTQFDRDWYECRRENTQPRAEKFGSYAGAGMVVNEDMARQCFAARGWRPAAPDAPPPQAPPSRPASTTSPEDVAASRARTERVQRLARELLDKPYYREPYACDDGGWTSVKNYVVDLAPWAEAAGLRKGDRLVAFGQVSLAQYDTTSAAWSMVPRGDAVVVRVDRGGQEVAVRLPCRDASESWRAGVAIVRAISDGRWDACTDAVQSYFRVTRMASAALLNVSATCMAEGAKATSRPAPEQFWRTLHAWATKAIEEARYRPTGLTDVRPGLLQASDALTKAGRSALADDIRQQIAAFSPAPPARP
jgi:hypothetical protein